MFVEPEKNKEKKNNKENVARYHKYGQQVEKRSMRTGPSPVQKNILVNFSADNT